jgi:hypothetical protein
VRQRVDTLHGRIVTFPTGVQSTTPMQSKVRFPDSHQGFGTVSWLEQYLDLRIYRTGTPISSAATFSAVEWTFDNFFYVQPARFIAHRSLASICAERRPRRVEECMECAATTRRIKP